MTLPQSLRAGTEFLLAARHPELAGWTSDGGNGTPSATVTSEVLLALDAVRSQALLERDDDQAVADLVAEMNAAIQDGVAYLRERLEDKLRADDYDVVNIALGLSAYGRLCSDVDAAFVGRLVQKLQAFRHGGGWRPTRTGGTMSTFAASLAFNALHDIRFSEWSKEYREKLNATDRTAIDDLYLATAQSLLEGFVDREATNAPSHPAVIAFVLQARARRGVEPTTSELPPSTRTAISGLCHAVDEIIANPFYELAECSYTLFYLPTVVRALSEYRGHLELDELTAYFRLAKALLSGETRHAVDGIPGAWKAPFGLHQRVSWPTAHALAALAYVSLDEHTVSKLSDALDDLVVKSSLLGQQGLAQGDFASIGGGAFWLKISNPLALGILGVGDLSVLTWMVVDRPDNPLWGVGYGAAIVLSVLLAIVVFAEDPPRKRWFNAVVSGFTVVTIIGGFFHPGS